MPLATKNLIRYFQISVKMKTILIIAFALMLSGAKAQPPGIAGTVTSVREMTTTLPELGEQKLLFLEIQVGENVQLALVSAKSNMKTGTTFTMHEAHDVPRYFVINGKKWYCYLDKYLKKVKQP